jgi:nicotinamidase/pyrazinamidase
MRTNDALMTRRRGVALLAGLLAATLLAPSSGEAAQYRAKRIKRPVRALLLVDLQNDFMPGGALAVTRGHEVVRVANRLMPHFDVVYASKDWHPANHSSFVEQGGIWPIHCVRNTKGAAFHPKLQTNWIKTVVRKGTDPAKDAYSAFEGTGLIHQVVRDKVTGLYVMGLATEYCDKATAMDAKELSKEHGFNVHLLTEGCRAVNVNPGDGQRAIEEMRGAEIIIVDNAAAALGL